MFIFIRLSVNYCSNLYELSKICKYLETNNILESQVHFIYLVLIWTGTRFFWRHLRGSHVHKEEAAQGPQHKHTTSTGSVVLHGARPGGGLLVAGVLVGVVFVAGAPVGVVLVAGAPVGLVLSAARPESGDTDAAAVVVVDCLHRWFSGWRYLKHWDLLLPLACCSYCWEHWAIHSCLVPDSQQNAWSNFLPTRNWASSRIRLRSDAPYKHTTRQTRGWSRSESIWSNNNEYWQQYQT